MEDTKYYSVLVSNETTRLSPDHQEDAGDGDKIFDSKDTNKVQQEQCNTQEQKEKQLEERGDAVSEATIKKNVYTETCKEPQNKPAIAGETRAANAARVKLDNNPVVAAHSAHENTPSHDDVQQQSIKIAEEDLKNIVKDLPSHIKSKVDRFVEHFGAAGAPSPIKPLRVIETHAADADSEESLELKINNTFVVPPLGDLVSKCIQHNGSQMSTGQQSNINLSELQQDATMASDIEEQARLNEVENSEHDNDKEARIIAELKDKDLLSRKRSQTEMEPAAFELPRATKYPHKDFPALPEFRSDSPPLMTFGDGYEDVFRARLSSKDACIQNITSFEEDMSVQEISANIGAGILTDLEEKQKYPAVSPSKEEPLVIQNEAQSHESVIQPSPMPVERNEPEGAETQSIDLNKTSAGDYFNKTLDMTLRTSGFSACGLGMLLAFDEMLDPAVGPLLPYGLRRRGANVIIFIASLVFAILFWFVVL
ncbi:uncharacterized protein LOC111247914 [Varroa destructor]|uniref:Uncharacterized protein n=1 Tax=Varroa destructor TaxID=109461 RepID=A0A7M7JPE7_VARDE|nr:uncharacterized protein LOC111247914 [Varroa destructor]